MKKIGVFASVVLMIGVASGCGGGSSGVKIQTPTLSNVVDYLTHELHPRDSHWSLEGGGDQLVQVTEILYLDHCGAYVGTPIQIVLLPIDWSTSYEANTEL